MTVTENMLFDAVRNALERVESEIASGPIVPSVTPGEIRAHLKSRYDFSKPGDLDAIGADVERMLRSGNVQVTHPRYLGLFNPSVTTPSVLADLLVAMYNPQLAAWRTAPAANEIERHTLLWLAAKFGFPADTAATFTTGGAEANLTAVIAALTTKFPRLWRSWAAQPEGSSGLVRHRRGPYSNPQDRAHHRTRPKRSPHRRCGPRSQNGLGGSGQESGRGSQERSGSLYGDWHRWHNRRRRDRSFA